ncbi:MAG: NB-ARC domain-containing protein [Oscillatoria sp. PMC 1051.18]|nr:NB-ARC domain-containing protein [Oscillatoria sp. PMC 1050.18]MEC5030092.1 NB-ARC domain-containing protein [Oscillatoria sp. PMC 1051.18]
MPKPPKIQPSARGKQLIREAAKKVMLRENCNWQEVISWLSYQTGFSLSTIKRFLGTKEEKARLSNKNRGCSQEKFVELCKILNLNWREVAELPAQTLEENQTSEINSSNNQDWGEAPDVPVFWGRETELLTLKQWIVRDRARLVAILGMGGIGKTHLSLKFSGRMESLPVKFGRGGIGKTELSLKLAREIQSEFDYIVWRSLLNAPPVTTLVADILKFLSHQQEIQLPETPETLTQQLSQLIDYLRRYRCLIILDNLETIIQPGAEISKYKPGYESYSQFLRKIGQIPHQSCLLLTSREPPPELELSQRNLSPIRALELSGLTLKNAQHLFEALDNFTVNSQRDWIELINLYNGNPLALKIVAKHIKEVFNGNISQFLQQGCSVFGSLNNLLSWHFDRLSEREQEIIYWLAINREPTTIFTLKDDLVSTFSQKKLPETLQSLLHKLPIEKSKDRNSFTLQPVLIEYTTERLIDSVCQEIQSGNLQIVKNYALLKAQSKDYLRVSQIRTILKPIKDRLLTIYKSPVILQKRLKNLLQIQREQYPLEPGYVGGNLLNLLGQLTDDFQSENFSNLTICQAYLVGKNLQHTDFSNSNLNKSVFTQSFGGIWSLAFSPDSQIIAVGDSHGQVRLLRVEDGQSIAIFNERHTWWTVSLAFSPDGEKLVSSSLDKTIKIWSINTGKCLKTIRGHTAWVWSTIFSPDSQIIASGSDDTTIKLWSVDTGEEIKTLTGHSSKVLSVAFSPNSQILASGSADETIKLWNWETGECLNTLTGHQDVIWTVAFSPNGQIIASCGCEKNIRLWDIKTGNCIKVLQGHNKEIKMLAFSPDGQTIASGCFEPTVRFWNVKTGKCQASLRGHKSGIRAVAFSPDNRTVATGDNDQIVKLWSVEKKECLKTFQGYNNWVYSVALSPDNQVIASSHLDHKIRLWNAQTGECLQTLTGHTAWIWSVVFSSSSKGLNLLASGGDDETIRLWNLTTGKTAILRADEKEYQGAICSVDFSRDGQFLASGGQGKILKLWSVNTRECLRSFVGHQGWIWSVAFSPLSSSDEVILASGSDDCTIKLWSIRTGECLRTLQGHTNKVRSVAFSFNGQFLVSGSEDNTLKVWDVLTGECQQTFCGHLGVIWSVKISSCGQFVVSGSNDQTIKVWSVKTGECIYTLQEHSDQVVSVGFSSDARMIVSGSLDGMIKQWDAQFGNCWQTLKVPLPYEGMKLTDVQGLTEGQFETLKALGAVE